jgi:hypothetical protein
MLCHATHAGRFLFIQTGSGQAALLSKLKSILCTIATAKLEMKRVVFQKRKGDIRSSFALCFWH